MANTYTSLHYHIVFSTKNPERWITTDVRNASGPILAASPEQNKMNPLQVGGIEDHVHLLLGAPPSIAASQDRAVDQGRLVGLDSRDVSHIDGFRVAGRVRRVYGEQVECAVGDRVHSRTSESITAPKLSRRNIVSCCKRHEIEFDERYVWG